MLRKKFIDDNCRQAVGYPVDITGEATEMCEVVKTFVRQFWHVTRIDYPVVLVDEGGTSIGAMESFAGKSRRLWNTGKQRKDQNAAKLILESFLEDVHRDPGELAALAGDSSDGDDDSDDDDDD